MHQHAFRIACRTIITISLLVPACITIQLAHVEGQEPVTERSAVERRARVQPPVPDEYKEVPFVETAPEPILTASEQAQGYMLFQRPITEPVYPNTNPPAHERLDRLVAFATPGEFEPVTMTVFPVRDLENLRVRVSALRGPAGTIPASAATVRLATYWNIGFPRYTSRDTYRRLPELLEQVTAHNAPAQECQRWWVTIHVPEGAKPGLYRATVTVSHDGFKQPVVIPLELRVLSFALQRDPGKRYSVYYYTRNPVIFQGRDESFIQQATGNEYRAMIDYGIDTIPTMSLQTDDTGKTILLRDASELDRMLKAGLRGPIPITAGNVIARIYRDTTPGGRRESHWVISKMPPPEFYERVTSMFAAFEAQRKKNGWPEFVCCPIDEVAASNREFGARVYQAVQKAGVRTYATKNPLAADAAAYRPYIDVWCSQPYSATYEKIVNQDRYEYWCYPNHNAGEIKDRRVMCKGGRMTYGFGFWRSGYTTLIPWHWAWTPRPDQFDYLRGSHSGSGQRVGDDGAVIPAIYWECFREGRDDARYIYTLQQAVWEREPTDDPKCRQLVAEGKSILQETWDSIFVQQKYLADDMWPSEEFNARRWRIAMATQALLEFPPVRHGTAPSVLVEDTDPKTATAESSLIQRAAAQGNLEFRDLGEDFDGWRNGTKEGVSEVTLDASQDGVKPGLRWRLSIDHENDGGEGGKYPVGWPRIARTFAENDMDLSAYDYLEFLVRVDSDRDEVADDSTPLGISVGSHLKTRRFFETKQDLGDQQRVWIPVRFALQDMIRTVGMGLDPWKTISRVQLHVSESDFEHGSHVTFDIAQARLLRFKSPMISQLEAPRYVLLPQSQLPVAFAIMGAGSVKTGSHELRATIVDDRGNSCASLAQDLADHTSLVLDIADLVPGHFQLKVFVVTASGQRCSELSTAFEAVAGPMYRE